MDVAPVQVFVVCGLRARTGFSVSFGYFIYLYSLGAWVWFPFVGFLFFPPPPLADATVLSGAALRLAFLAGCLVVVTLARGYFWGEFSVDFA